MTRQRRIPAAWMRGGTSKGLFMLARDLPADDATRDALLARLLGSPDPYGKQIDGLGGATSSTSKVVILAPSSRVDCDVDFLFGQVPVSGEIREAGDFMLDGVVFPAAEIRLEFLDPAGSGAAGLFPTGRIRDRLHTAEETVDATLISAGNPMVLVDAAALGLDCSASQTALNAQPGLLARCERIRVAGALAMGLAASEAEAQARAHTPKLAVLDRPKAFRAADGCEFAADDTDLACRVLSMGVFHHAIPGTAAIAIAAAAAIPGTVASDHVCETGTSPLRLGQPSGCTRVGVDAHQTDAGWTLGKAVMSRSARMLMDGFVCLPG